MTKIILWAFFIVFASFSLSATLDDAAYCYQYTWVAPTFNIKPGSFNCTHLNNFPCIDPPIITEEPPNIDDYWGTNKPANESLFCTLTSANVCIKYTYMFNGGIVRMSSFCGRVIEDDKIPITSGCYEQRKSSHDLQVCACQSRKGKRPCNMSVQTRYSVTLIVTAFIFTVINIIH